MSNILVGKNYTITDHSKWYDDKTAIAPQLVEDYATMESILKTTAEKHVVGLDEIIIHRGEADNIRDVFKIHFKEIYNLWQEGHNILYCDLDAMFLQEAEYFDKFDNFLMFNLTDPTSTYDEHYDIKFDNFFNCGIRYYPKSMSNEVWDLGFRMLDDWNPDRWDCEQIIYNAMMFSQNITAEEAYDPRLSFQMLFETPADQRNTQFNRIHISEAKAVHLHGSRNSRSRVDTMSSLVKEVPKDTQEFSLFL